MSQCMPYQSLPFKSLIISNVCYSTILHEITMSFCNALNKKSAGGGMKNVIGIQL
jgi:hypothetical protein